MIQGLLGDNYFASKTMGSSNSLIKRLTWLKDWANEATMTIYPGTMCRPHINPLSKGIEPLVILHLADAKPIRPSIPETGKPPFWVDRKNRRVCLRKNLAVTVGPTMKSGTLSWLRITSTFDEGIAQAQVKEVINTQSTVIEYGSMFRICYPFRFSIPY